MGLKEILEKAKARAEQELNDIKAQLHALDPMGRKRVHLYAILDKSGSMDHLTDDTIGGYNQFIREQAADRSTDLTVTLTLFASPGDLRVLYSDVPVDRVPALTRDTYKADGASTALNDAVAFTLKGIKPVEGEAYLVLVITDGFENASTVHSKSTVRELIKSLEVKGNFTFAYIGSDPSTWGEAASYGIARGSTFSYTGTGIGVQNMYRHVSNSTSGLRSSIATTNALASQDFATLGNEDEEQTVIVPPTGTVTTTVPNITTTNTTGAQ